MHIRLASLVAAVLVGPLALVTGCVNDVGPAEVRAVITEDGAADEGLANDPDHAGLEDDDTPVVIDEEQTPSDGDEQEGEGGFGTFAARRARCDADARTGDYCGGDKVSNARADTLYRCNGPGPATVLERCDAGCHVAPPGHDDYCNEVTATCDGNAHTGDYCGGDKVSHANPDTLYRCNGPGPAHVIRHCSDGCVVAPPGQDDYCDVDEAQCAHASLLRWGLAPRQSDHLRCAGVTASGISQTIGSAAASAGTHAQDGSIQGHPYSAATDLRTTGLTNTQVRALLHRLADQGVAAFFRDPGQDGWPSSEVRHIHAIYVGVPMKASLRAQVNDWLNGRNGLASHASYTFWQPSAAQKQHIRALFDAHN